MYQNNISNSHLAVLSLPTVVAVGLIQLYQILPSPPLPEMHECLVEVSSSPSEDISGGLKVLWLLAEVVWDTHEPPSNEQV